MERKGALEISSELFKKIFNIPKDVIIVGSKYVAEHDTIKLYLKGSNKKLYKVGEGCEIPSIPWIIKEEEAK